MNENELYLQNRNDERKEIKLIGLLSGLCIVASVLLQNLIALVLYIPQLRVLYFSVPVFQDFMTIISSVVSIGLPFGLTGVFFEKVTGANVFAFNAPENKSLSVLAVFFGFFICLIANYVTSVFVSVFDYAGIHLTAPEYSVSSGLASRAVYFFTVAVVPAFIEETAIRGAVMQPLRKYGDTFAVVISAAVFAILHCNLVQAPFAFMVGIAIGYAVCLTGSLWTGIAIHLVNNTYSAIAEFIINDIPDEEDAAHVMTLIMILLYIVTVIGTVGFLVIKNKTRLKNELTYLTTGQKTAAFFINITMIIAFCVTIMVTKEYISF